VSVLTTEEQRIAKLLGQGYTRAAVAQALGVSEPTIQRRLRANPAILEAAQDEQVDRDPDAVEVLRQLLQSDREDIRLKAATALLHPNTRLAADAPDSEPDVVINVYEAEVDADAA
jgi:transposase-like protein